MRLLSNSNTRVKQNWPRPEPENFGEPDTHPEPGAVSSYGFFESSKQAPHFLSLANNVRSTGQ